MTETDALLQASDELCAALQNAAPKNKTMEKVVNVLVSRNIFREGKD